MSKKASTTDTTNFVEWRIANDEMWAGYEYLLTDEGGSYYTVTMRSLDDPLDVVTQNIGDLDERSIEYAIRACNSQRIRNDKKSQVVEYGVRLVRSTDAAI